MTTIQTPSGESYGTNYETPSEAVDRLRAAGWLVQRLGNVVRCVRFMGPGRLETDDETNDPRRDD